MKKKIYCFVNSASHEWFSAVAIGEDGIQLAGHVCSSEGWIPHDLGITSDWKHEVYNEHFGEGNWELEFVHSSEIKTHTGLQEAFRLNKLLQLEREKKHEHR